MSPWVHGAVRWLAGSVVAGGFMVFVVALFHAFLGLERPIDMMLHGVAATNSATAIGIFVIGRSGIDRGFAAALSAGLVAVATLLSLGVADGPGAQWLPIASLTSEGAAWGPLLVSGCLGGLATLLFSRRSGL